MIAATDWVVAGICFYAYFKLNQLKGKGMAFILFRYYFLLLGLATFWGGLVTHAFIYLLSDVWKVPGWLTGMVAIALISSSSVEYNKEIIGKNITAVLYVLILVELITVMAITTFSINFKWTGYHSAFGLVAIVAPLHAQCWRKSRDLASRLILISIFIFCLSGIVFTLKISPHIWFNYVDLTHIILALAVYIFYRAAVLMKN